MLHSRLVELQQRVAGHTPRPVLEKLYAGGDIDAQEFVTLMLAQGQDEETALAILEKTHAQHKPEQAGELDGAVIEPDLPEYAGPKRAAKRVSKRGPELRGHPLD